MTGPTFFMVTAQLNVRYRKPVPPETPLEVYGMAGERKGRVAKAHAEIRTLEGDVLTEADLVLVDIPDKKMAGVDLEEMGWKVYPDEED
jgi:acyl-coenzyme A thioesterase PaaI-like protein